MQMFTTFSSEQMKDPGFVAMVATWLDDPNGSVGGRLHRDGSFSLWATARKVKEWEVKRLERIYSMV